jgi:hypothetical protein
MCAVSNISDYGRTWWNDPSRFSPNAPVLPLYPRPDEEIERIRNFKEEFDKLRKQAEEFDRKTQQPGCEDPSKWDWYKELVARIEALELALEVKKIKKLAKKKAAKRITKERKKIRTFKGK